MPHISITRAQSRLQSRPRHAAGPTDSHHAVDEVSRRSTECARVHVVQITHAPAPKLLYSSSAHDRVGPDTTPPTQRDCVTQLPDSASIEKHHHDAAVDRRATELSRNVPRIQQIGPSARRSLPSLRDLALPVPGRGSCFRVAKNTHSTSFFL